MLKNELQAIEIIAFLVTEYRRAFNHGGDYESIEVTRQTYCNFLATKNKLTEEELHILYLKGKIKADEEQLQRHKVEVAKLKNKKETI